MRIGILGSGLMGGKLGTLFARAGHEVVFSYSRSEKKLNSLAREAAGNARAGTPGEAARNADAVLLAVHWSRMDDVLSQAGDLSGKVVVSCSLPMNDDDTALVVAHTSSGAEVLAKKARGAHFVCAFNTVPSEVLFGVFERRSDATEPRVLRRRRARKEGGRCPHPRRGLRARRRRAATNRPLHGTLRAPRRPARLRGERRPRTGVPVRTISREVAQQHSGARSLGRCGPSYLGWSTLKKLRSCPFTAHPFSRGAFITRVLGNSSSRCVARNTGQRCLQSGGG